MPCVLTLEVNGLPLKAASITLAKMEHRCLLRRQRRKQSEEYPEPYQTSKMGEFCENNSSFSQNDPFQMFRLGSEYTSDSNITKLTNQLTKVN